MTKNYHEHDHDDEHDHEHEHDVEYEVRARRRTRNGRVDGELEASSRSRGPLWGGPGVKRQMNVGDHGSPGEFGGGDAFDMRSGRR
jgi:hypothetical protein